MALKKATLFLVKLVLLIIGSAASATEFPPISSVLPCGTLGTGGLNPGTGVWRVDIDTAAFPGAVCNDGTGAVMYVRRASTPLTLNHWHIHLQGGGTCGSADDCAERWCSIDTNFGMDKMTSSFAPPNGANANGMLSRNAGNPLNDWNQVLVYYCSSDSWSGTQAGIDLTANSPVGGKTVNYSISFQGGHIVDAVIETLRRTNGSVQYSDETASRTMPDLDDAQRVILAGASAGGAGVIRQADRVHERLLATNNNCRGAGDCGLDYRVVFDSAYAPDQSMMSFAQTNICIDFGLCTYDEYTAWIVNTSQIGLWQAQTDDSCQTWHAAHMPGFGWRCGDTLVIVENHLLAPHFIRFDLLDSLIQRGQFEAGYTYMGLPIDRKVFGLLSYEQLMQVQNLWQTAAEGHDGRGEPATKPAVFGPQCTHHGSLLNTGIYLDVRAPDDKGVLRGMPELLSNWLNGSGPTKAIVDFNGNPSPPGYCDTRSSGSVR